MRKFTIAALATPLAALALWLTPANAQALPGQCFNTPWGGFCDSEQWADGSFNHCEGAMGFSNCFRACHDPLGNGRIPTDYDANTPC